ncbi:MAG TPA: hypothetical protein VEK11_25645 [Thermoanaerobaculia bacterium]|nr:hypothetical protein [Thermoanaerobaculia bacterium]
MPISFPHAPAAAIALISEHLALPPRSARRGVATETAGGPAIGGQHQIYTIPGEAILRGELLAAAQSVGWRYLVMEDGDVIVAAELSGHTDRDLAFAQTSTGAFVHGMSNAIALAERLDDVQRRDYELRLLRIPAAYFVAVWLHHETDDLLVPLAPAPAGIDPERVYVPQELLPHLIPVVQKNAVLGRE